MESVDDPVRAAGGGAVDSLGELEVRVHARGGCDEPGAKMLTGVPTIAFVAGEQPCSGERGHLDGERDHCLAVVTEVGGIALAVAVDVGAVGIFGIGPEIVRLREVVVWTAGAAVRWVGSDGPDGQGEIGVSRFEDSFA